MKLTNTSQPVANCPTTLVARTPVPTLCITFQNFCNVYASIVKIRRAMKKRTHRLRPFYVVFEDLYWVYFVNLTTNCK